LHDLDGMGDPFDASQQSLRVLRCRRRRFQLEADLRLDARLHEAAEGHRGEVVF
jgi:hypothetical protein